MNRLLGALLLTSLFSNVQAEQLTLGVEDAIDHAVQSNLRTRLAQEKIKEIEAEVEAGYAALRPRFNLNVAQYNRSVNLASQGLSGAELPIPNRIVKPVSADGTATPGGRVGRRLPQGPSH